MYFIAIFPLNPKVNFFDFIQKIPPRVLPADYVITSFEDFSQKLQLFYSLPSQYPRVCK